MFTFQKKINIRIMKNALVLLFAIVFYGGSWAQCPQSIYITFITQEDVDNFAIEYPDCKEIPGSVDIGTSSIAIPGYAYNLYGLRQITSIGGGLNISNNHNLIDLRGLDSLTYVGGRLDIEQNLDLKNLMGLNNLSTVGDDLYIQANWELESFKGLENLTSVYGRITIDANDKLSSLEGISNINQTTITTLSIHDNDTLSMCSVPSICSYLGSHSAMIYDNASGCNDIPSILEACTTVSVNSPNNISQITILPNPNVGIFQVNGIPQGTYQIHDSTGRIIQSGKKNDLSIDISQEAQGVYFISIQMDNELITKRIIKL